MDDDLFVFVRSQVHSSLDKRLRRENSGVVIRSSRSRACSRVNPLVASVRGELLYVPWSESDSSAAVTTRIRHPERSYTLLVACFYCHSSVFFIRHLLSLFSWGLASKCCLAQLAICPTSFSLSLSFKSSSIYIYKYKYTFLADRTEQTRFTLIVQSPLSLKEKKERKKVELIYINAPLFCTER